VTEAVFFWMLHLKIFLNKLLQTNLYKFFYIVFSKFYFKLVHKLILIYK